MPTRNGTNGGPSWKWIVGGLIAVLFAFSGAYIKNNAATVAEIQVRTVALEVSMSAVKTDLNYLKTGVDDIKALLRTQKGTP